MHAQEISKIILSGISILCENLHQRKFPAIRSTMYIEIKLQAIFQSIQFYFVPPPPSTSVVFKSHSETLHSCEEPLGVQLNLVTKIQIEAIYYQQDACYSVI